MKEYVPIKGRDFDGAYRTDEVMRNLAAIRRRENKDAGLCINGAHHGKATHGVRCYRCLLVYMHGIATARTLPDWPGDSHTAAVNSQP